MERSAALAPIVQLRPVLSADLPVLFEFQFDPPANRMAAFPARGFDEFMLHWTKLLIDPAVLLRAVVVDGALVGNVTAFDQEGKRLIGYWIGRRYWGRGFASAALAEFLRHESVRPLHAYVAKHNAGSIRVLQKCGFAVCGESKGPSESPGVEVEDFVMELK